MTELSAKQLRKAANLKDRITTLETELAKLLGSRTATPAKEGKRKRRKMSASARAAIGAAQKARWAKWKKDKKG